MDENAEESLQTAEKAVKSASNDAEETLSETVKAEAKEADMKRDLVSAKAAAQGSADDIKMSEMSMDGLKKRQAGVEAALRYAKEQVPPLYPLVNCPQITALVGSQSTSGSFRALAVVHKWQLWSALGPQMTVLVYFQSTDDSFSALSVHRLQP